MPILKLKGNPQQITEQLNQIVYEQDYADFDALREEADSREVDLDNGWEPNI